VPWGPTRWSKQAAQCSTNWHSHIHHMGCGRQPQSMCAHDFWLWCKPRNWNSLQVTVLN